MSCAREVALSAISTCQRLYNDLQAKRVAVDKASGRKSFLEAHKLNQEADNLKLQLDSSVQDLRQLEQTFVLSRNYQLCIDTKSFLDDIESECPYPPRDDTSPLKYTCPPSLSTPERSGFVREDTECKCEGNNEGAFICHLLFLQICIVVYNFLFLFLVATDDQVAHVTAGLSSLESPSKPSGKTSRPRSTPRERAERGTQSLSKRLHSMSASHPPNEHSLPPTIQRDSSKDLFVGVAQSSYPMASGVSPRHTLPPGTALLCSLTPFQLRLNPSQDFIAVNAAAEAQANAAAEAVTDAHDHAKAQADAEAATDALDLDRPPWVSLSPTSKYEQRKGTKMSVRCNAS